MVSTCSVSEWRRSARAVLCTGCLIAIVAVVSAAMPAAAQTEPTEPDLTLVKEGSLVLAGSQAVPGDIVDYTFSVSDASVECVSDVTVSDPLVPVISCPSGSPIGGLPEVCTGTYPITQADIDAGFVNNTATAVGLNNCAEQTETVMSSDSVTIPQAPAIDLIKDGILDLGGDGVANVGDVINYSLQVVNGGNVTLSGIEISDPVVEMITCPSGQPIPTLAPGASETCTGTYAIIQADIDAGFKENTADVSASDGGQRPTVAAALVSAQATIQVAISQTASIQVTKDGVLDLGGNGVADPGDLVNYTFLVNNNGNVTLTNVAVTDPLVSPVVCPSGNPIPMLAVSASETCTGSYAITAADIAAGNVVNTADAAGTDPAAQPVLDGDTDTVMLPAAVPTLPPVALGILMLVLAVAGAFFLRARRVTA